MARKQRSSARPSTSRRAASTMAAPRPAMVPATRPSATPAQAPVQAGANQRQPGLMAQMASTAAGVAIGSTIGHTLGAGISRVFGGGDDAPQQAEPVNTMPSQFATTAESAGFNQQGRSGLACEFDAKNLSRCMEQNSMDVSACQYYIDMLRQCQEFQKSQQF